MKLTRSFTNAFGGIKYCWRNEQNFRIHLGITSAVIVLSILFHISKIEWLFVMGSCALVLVTETFNTALEKLCDIITKEFHPPIKIIKDVAAGAVLLSAIGSAVTGCIIFIPKIISEVVR